MEYQVVCIRPNRIPLGSISNNHHPGGHGGIEQGHDIIRGQSVAGSVEDELAGQQAGKDLPDLSFPRARREIVEFEDGDETDYTLVGEEESDPAQGRISVYSPLAQGLLHKKSGEKAHIELPAGTRAFTIVKICPS